MTYTPDLPLSRRTHSGYGSPTFPTGRYTRPPLRTNDHGEIRISSRLIPAAPTCVDSLPGGETRDQEVRRLETPDRRGLHRARVRARDRRQEVEGPRSILEARRGAEWLRL